MNAKVVTLVILIVVITVDAKRRTRRKHPQLYYEESDTGSDQQEVEREQLLQLARSSLASAKRSYKAAKAVVDALEDSDHIESRGAALNFPVWPIYKGQSSSIGQPTMGATAAAAPLGGLQTSGLPDGSPPDYGNQPMPTRENPYGGQPLTWG